MGEGNILDNFIKVDGGKNCPNCGAPIETDKCPYCGTVFIDFACMDADKPFYLKIKKNDIVHIAKVVLTGIEISQDCCTTVYGYDQVFIQSPITEINISCQVVY